MPNFVSLFLIKVVTDKESARSRTILNADADFTRVAGLALVAVWIKNNDVVKGAGFTHRTDLGRTIAVVTVCGRR